MSRKWNLKRHIKNIHQKKKHTFQTGPYQYNSFSSQLLTENIGQSRMEESEDSWLRKQLSTFSIFNKS